MCIPMLLGRAADLVGKEAGKIMGEVEAYFQCDFGDREIGFLQEIAGMFQADGQLELQGRLTGQLQEITAEGGLANPDMRGEFVIVYLFKGMSKNKRLCLPYRIKIFCAGLVIFLLLDKMPQERQDLPSC